MPKSPTAWPTTNIRRSSYLRGRIGWQGLRASEFIDHGPFLITGTDFLDSGRIDWSRCYHVSEQRFREGAYIHVRDGDLLVTKDGTIGKIAYVRDCPEKAVLNSGVFLLRCSDDSYDHRFLYHLLRSELFKTFLRMNLAGSTISHLYQYVFERFEFPTPTIAIQKKMAEILSTLDEAIDQTEALIAKTQAIKAGLMHDLFTRGVMPDGQLRPPREEAPKLYKESTLGWIPREWEAFEIRQLADLITSGSRGWAAYYSAAGALFVRSQNVRMGNLDFADRQYVVPPRGSEGQRTQLCANDLLVTITGNSVGNVAFVPQDWTEVAFVSQHVGLVRLHEPGFAELAMNYLAPGSPGNQQLLDAQYGQSKPGLNLDNLRDLLVPVPAVSEREAIVDRISAARTRLESEIAYARHLHSVKSGLMHDLLTGRVRVPENLGA